MKAGILTFHNADNCGAVLQAYALTNILNTMPDCDAELIDYHNERLEESYRPFSLLKSKNPIKFIGKIILRAYTVFKRHNGFDDFRQKYLRISEKDYYFSNRSEILNDYDVIFSGSDQVFNLNISGGNDTTYFCDFSDKKSVCKKYTYAASIGDIPTEKTKVDRLIGLLKKNFGYLSFREKTAVDFMNEHCPEISCTSHLDPVFLLSGKEWKGIALNRRLRPYVIYFSVQDPKMMGKAMCSAADFAESKKLRAYYSSATFFSVEKRLRYLSCESPDVFLGNIKNAEYVFTDSFHGTALCILMHKNFFVETNITRSSRVLDLLELTGLKSRAMVDGKINCKYEITDEEWKYADEQIENQRKVSINYLRSIINNKDESNE